MTTLGAKHLLFSTLGAAALLAACGGASSAPADLGVWTPGAVPTTGTAGSSSALAGASTATPGSGSSSGAGGSAGSSGVAGGPSPVAGSSGLPCDVATVLASKCTVCHSDPPIGGALSGLVTYADLTATAKEDPTRNEAQLSVVRMQSTSSPMPPATANTPATSSDIATIQAWINAGYPSGSCGGDGGAAVDASPAITVVDVFKGRPAFASQVGPSSHNPGRDCMSCHATGGGEAPRFMFGGTLYNGSGAAVSGAEVRVVDANGTGYSVYTSSNGNFYQQGTGLVTPAHAGARNALGSQLMVSAVTSGGCNSCHCSGSGCATTPLHLP
jgi:hypothetical protein